MGIVSFLICLNANASSPVWKISKEETHLYVGGTMHLLSSADHPLPKAFDTAYRQASTVVLETDLSLLQTPEYMQKMTETITFADGRTLESVLKPETYKALTKYFDSRRLPTASFAPYTPVGVGLTIAVIEMQRMGMSPESGVDQFYTLMAQNDDKRLGQLETPDEHLSFLSAIGKGKEDKFILKTLSDIERMPELMGELKSAWRNGNNKKMEALAMSELKQEFPDVYQVLLVDRNNAWLPKIETMLASKEIELILVGAMHLVGKEGLIQQLKNKGYTAENL